MHRPLGKVDTSSPNCPRGTRYLRRRKVRGRPGARRVTADPERHAAARLRLWSGGNLLPVEVRRGHRGDGDGLAGGLDEGRRLARRRHHRATPHRQLLRGNASG